MEDCQRFRRVSNQWLPAMVAIFVSEPTFVGAVLFQALATAAMPPITVPKTLFHTLQIKETCHNNKPVNQSVCTHVSTSVYMDRGTGIRDAYVCTHTHVCRCIHIYYIYIYIFSYIYVDTYVCVSKHMNLSMYKCICIFSTHIFMYPLRSPNGGCTGRTRYCVCM